MVSYGSSGPRWDKNPHGRTTFDARIKTLLEYGTLRDGIGTSRMYRTDSNTTVAHPDREHTSLRGYGHIKLRIDISEKEKKSEGKTPSTSETSLGSFLFLFSRKEVRFPS